MSQRRLRIGIIGAARVAVYAMIGPAKENPRVAVAGVAARDQARAEAFAAAHGIAKAYGSYDDLIGEPAIDVIYVATPPAHHMRPALKALAAGKHVLVEKPFAMNAHEARSILEAAARSGRRAFEAFHYRHHAVWRRIVEIVRSGTIGEVREIEASFHVPIPRNADEFRWNGALGGGALMDLGCYPLQWARVVAGAEPTVTGARMRMVDGVDAETTAELSFPSGARAHVSCRMDGEGMQALLRVAGARGSLHVVNPLAPQMGHVLELHADGAHRKETVPGPSTFAAQLDAVAAALLDGAPFPLSTDDPVKSMTVIDAVRRAAG